MVILQAIEQLMVRRPRIEGLKMLLPEVATLPAPLLRWQRLSQWIWVAIMGLAAVVMGLGVTLSG